MTPILSLAIGLIVGLIAMWLIMRYTVGKREQEQAARFPSNRLTLRISGPRIVRR